VLYVESGEEGDEEIPVCQVSKELGSHKKYSAVSYSPELRKRPEMDD
jgi:hypothetical protein